MLVLYVNNLIIRHWNWVVGKLPFFVDIQLLLTLQINFCILDTNRIYLQLAGSLSPYSFASPDCSGFALLVVILILSLYFGFVNSINFFASTSISISASSLIIQYQRHIITTLFLIFDLMTIYIHTTG